MKLRFAVAAACSLAACSSALARDLNQIQSLGQGEFRAFSEDLGAALSYKPLTPAAPLGTTGFDIGVALTATKLRNTEEFNKASGGGDFGATLPIPSFRFSKGLPADFDFGLMASGVPGTNIRLLGGEIRYALLAGSAVLPAIGLRGSYTRLGGVDQLDYSTRGADLSISKGFLNVTPYGGVGRVWVTSTPKGIPSLKEESFSLHKVFGGVNINLGIVNLAFETDKTGNARSYGAKVGWRF